MSAWPGATAQPSGPGSMGEGDDRDTVEGLDVCGSDGPADGDRPGVAAHRIFRRRVAAATGVGAVALGAVDHADAGVLGVGDVHLVGCAVDGNAVRAEAGRGDGGRLGAAVGVVAV